MIVGLLLAVFGTTVHAYIEQEVHDCRDLAMDVPPDYKLGGGVCKF